MDFEGEEQLMLRQRRYIGIDESSLKLDDKCAVICGVN